MKHGAKLLLVAIVGIFTAGTAGAQTNAAPSPRPAHPLFIMNADGSELAQLVNMPEYDAHGSPEWSADGKTIAFDAWRASVGENHTDAHVFVANADGSQPRDLGPGAMPSFSPGGYRIVFTQYSPNHGVWIMNADGTGAELLDEDGWSGQWSPDGVHIAYTVSRNGANVIVYNVVERQRRRILEGPHAQSYRSIYWNPGWSPDGKRICFKGQKSDGTYEVAVADVSGSSTGFKVLFAQEAAADFSWHPDGKQILFSMREPKLKYQQLYVVNGEKNDPPKLYPGQPTDRANLNADWSPDGKRIIFSSREVP